MPPELNFQGIKLPDGINREMVRKAALKFKIAEMLDRQYGAGVWGVKEIVLYLQDPTTVAKRNNTQAKRYERTIAGRLEEYTDSYENITPNDRVMFETLVGLEMRLETVRAELDSASDAKDISDLTKALQVLSSEHRQIQTTLGIGRAKRGEQFNLQNELDAYLNSAKELIEKRQVKIDCAICKSEIDLGFILYHFSSDTPWSFMFTCPRCGKLISQSGAVQFSNSPVSGGTNEGDELPTRVLDSGPKVSENGTNFGLGTTGDNPSRNPEGELLVQPPEQFEGFSGDAPEGEGG